MRAFCVRHIKKYGLTSKDPETVVVGQVVEVKPLQVSPYLVRHSDTRLRLDRFRLALEGFVKPP